MENLRKMLFGKTMENLRKIKNVRLVNNANQVLFHRIYSVKMCCYSCD